MFFLHDYFLHMWNASRTKDFEPNEYKKLAKGFFLNNNFPCNLLLQSFKTLKFSYDLCIHQVDLMNM
jgi:hypothetical protein